MRGSTGAKLGAGLAIAAAASLVLVACGGGGGGGGKAAAGGTCNKGTAASANQLTVASEPDGGVAKPTSKCWADIPATTMAIADVGTEPSGASATFKAAWSAKDLYVSAYAATWPLYNKGTPESTNWWQSDTTEFTVSGSDSHSGPYSSGHTYQLAVDEDGSLQTSGDNGANASPMPAGSALIVPNKGFYTELIVPWATLGVSAPAKGQKYQFDIGQDFGNAQGTRLAQMVWSADPGNSGGAQDWHQDDANWGDITLG